MTTNRFIVECNIKRLQYMLPTASIYTIDRVKRSHYRRQLLVLPRLELQIPPEN